jgi:hypothetical protein
LAQEVYSLPLCDTLFHYEDYLGQVSLKESEDAIVKTGLVASIFGFLFNIVTFIFFLIFSDDAGVD